MLFDIILHLNSTTYVTVKVICWPWPKLTGQLSLKGPPLKLQGQLLLKFICSLQTEGTKKLIYLVKVNVASKDLVLQYLYK